MNESIANRVNEEMFKICSGPTLNIMYDRLYYVILSIYENYGDDCLAIELEYKSQTMLIIHTKDGLKRDLNIFSSICQENCLIGVRIIRTMKVSV